MSSTIVVDDSTPWVKLTLHRPDQRNAMNATMVDELLSFFASPPPNMRALVIRGAKAHFCAGGDVKDMMRALSAEGPDPVAALNRSFGHLLTAVEACPVPVIALVEGAVMGGGFGLACVADIVLAVDNVMFRLPEASLGITPAQIAPFLVRKLGLATTRRLALTARSLDAQQAFDLGLVHQVFATSDDALEGVRAELALIARCEPKALAATKRLLVGLHERSLQASLDKAATSFSELARSETAQQGMLAFAQRRPAPWVENVS